MRAYSQIGPDVSVPLLPSSGHRPARESQGWLSAGAIQRTYEVGARVTLVHLSNATQLNGCSGVVTHTIDESQVVYVQLDAAQGENMINTPVKFHAKFLKLAEAHEHAGDACHSLPPCVSVDPESLADKADPKANRMWRVHQMRVEAMHAARECLQTASRCLLGKPFASAWAIDGCNAGNTGSPAFCSSRSLSGGRTFREEAQRRTWCKPTGDLEIDIECSGIRVRSVDGAINLLNNHEQVLQRKCEEQPMDVLSSSSDTCEIDDELLQAGQDLVSLSVSFQNGGRYEEACELASGALSIARRVPGLAIIEARASMLMGWAKLCAGRYVEARHHARQAGLIFLQSGDESPVCKCGQVDTAVVLGECNHRLWRYHEASESLLFALTKARQMSDRRRQCEILAKLSKVLADMGKSQSASEHAHEALMLSQDDCQAANAIGAKSFVFAQMGEHEVAATHAREQLAASSRGVSYEHTKGKERALFSLGMAQLALDLPDEAEKTFLLQQEAAVWLGDMTGEADALQGLSMALVALRQYDLALDTLREEEVLWDCIGDFMRRRRCLDRLCKMLEKMKHKADAMVIRRREGTSMHPLAPLFSNEDFNQLHFDEDHVIVNPRLCHYERPHPWSDLLVLTSLFSLTLQLHLHLNSARNERNVKIEMQDKLRTYYLCSDG